jgi:hypothetical protein
MDRVSHVAPLRATDRPKPVVSVARPLEPVDLQAIVMGAGG